MLAGFDEEQLGNTLDEEGGAPLDEIVLAPLEKRRENLPRVMEFTAPPVPISLSKLRIPSPVGDHLATRGG